MLMGPISNGLGAKRPLNNGLRLILTNRQKAVESRVRGLFA